jgi:hypothetical protein
MRQDRVVENVLWAVVAIFGLAGWVTAVIVLRRARPGTPYAVPSVPRGHSVRITLEMDVRDPDAPEVQRLVHDAATRMFAAHPDVDEIVVLSRSGTVLGTRERKTTLPEHLVGPTTIPPQRRPVARARTPESAVMPLQPGDLPVSHFLYAQRGLHPDEQRRPVADRFELNDDVRGRVRDPNEPADVVRAILESAGLAPRVERDLLVVGNEAIVVLNDPMGPILPDRLSHAFVRFRDSGASQGFVIGLGFMEPRDVKRREMMEPSFVHLGPDAIQRMADAAALGADPLRFARGPALLTA